MVPLNLRIRLDIEKETKINISTANGLSKSKMLISLQGDLQGNDVYFSSTASYNSSKHKLHCVKLQRTQLDESCQLQVLVSNLAEEAARQHRALWCFPFEDT